MSDKKIILLCGACPEKNAEIAERLKLKFSFVHLTFRKRYEDIAIKMLGVSRTEWDFRYNSPKRYEPWDTIPPVDGLIGPMQINQVQLINSLHKSMRLIFPETHYMYYAAAQEVNKVYNRSRFVFSDDPHTSDGIETLSLMTEAEIIRINVGESFSEKSRVVTDHFVSPDLSTVEAAQEIMKLAGYFPIDKSSVLN